MERILHPPQSVRSTVALIGQRRLDDRQLLNCSRVISRRRNA